MSQFWKTQVPDVVAHIYESNELGKSVAKCNRLTGEVWLNKKMFNNLPDDLKLFVVAHEAGHIALNTNNEFEADKWAFEYYINTVDQNGNKRSLRNAINSLNNLLPMTNGEQEARLLRMLIHALKYDFQVNRNENAREELQLILKEYPLMRDITEAEELEAQFIGNLINNINDKASEIKSNIQENRQERRMERQENRQERRDMRFERRQARKYQRAENKAYRDNITNSNSGAAIGPDYLISNNSVPGSNPGYFPSANNSNDQPSGMTTQTMLMIGLGVVALAAVVLILMKKK